MDINRLLHKKDAAEGKKIVESWGSLTWHANGKIPGTKGVTVGRVVIKKGMCNPRHSHPNCEEVLYLLQGRLEHTVGDEKIILESGDTILIEAGVAHNAVSIGDCDADMIVVYSSPERQTVAELNFTES